MILEYKYLHNCLITYKKNKKRREDLHSYQKRPSQLLLKKDKKMKTQNSKNKCLNEIFCSPGLPCVHTTARKLFTKGEQVHKPNEKR